ncbi:MAG: DNA polymerase III subunit gamma/tau [Dokdonella sp.]|uniref:DNA polymerase III subunit gamma/tau n=1 Tax=Dokdonella sp. TaxID=2291710 RepID=UPI0025B9993A|nr:DNA polymerase III subunit gamma/tau [Dokdonella sp.]MBX3699960.1 DNA polymerase III subunit gamma/tau [Dokdonella sp.]
MSYQALARKWRPRRFAELVGQEHVVRALTHALDSGRLHHAFLFTGTRGVGKTTIARIFAKSLNCDRGPTSDPCGQCSACSEIDAGRFVDLLEIDAASNTGIDNVRELIDNAQYAPTRGRHKVYLIDEVHMLSRSAFNALLKTLEEPPPHVKFLLATTDPQKLPVTVLSRCIKFNLKRLSPEQISGQMRHILEAEQVGFDAEAIDTLAIAADGSLRDGLSLLDQAIAHGGGTLQASEVHAMLGTVERAKVQQLLVALARGDAAALLAEIEHIAGFAPDFAQVLDELAGLLHRVQVAQLVAASADAAAGRFAAELSAQDVQLWYQIAVTGRRDLPLAPTPRVGFEMCLLRMLAFAPGGAAAGSASDGRTPVAAAASARGPAARATGAVAPPAATQPATTPPAATQPAATPTSGMTQAGSGAADAGARCAEPVAVDDWAALIERAGLRGPLGQIAQHSTLLTLDASTLRLAIEAAHEHLLTASMVAQLERSISNVLGRDIRVRFERTAQAQAHTPARQRAQAATARQSEAEGAVARDPVVRALVDTFDARVIADSVRPLG